MVFSDETYFQFFRNTVGVGRCTKNPQQELKRIPKNKQKIIVWVAFSIKGQISCYSFKRTMDGRYYVEILENYLLDGTRKQFEQRWSFQQDNDLKHKSRIGKQFLEQEVPETIERPSSSPDINPIENMCSILEQRVEKRKSSNIDELERFLYEEWQKVDMATISNLVKSMKNRCLAVIDSNGERRNY